MLEVEMFNKTMYLYLNAINLDNSLLNTIFVYNQEYSIVLSLT